MRSFRHAQPRPSALHSTALSIVGKLAGVVLLGLTGAGLLVLLFTKLALVFVVVVSLLSMGDRSQSERADSDVSHAFQASGRPL